MLVEFRDIPAVLLTFSDALRIGAILRKNHAATAAEASLRDEAR